jgi:cytochrome d ubiquinol oxidase subunit II
VSVELFWFGLVSFFLIAYVVLDGFDIGVGILTMVVARTDSERKALIDTIKPVWDGNEVWLLGAAGALYFAFPPAYAASFSGLYLPLSIAIWLLILRGLGVELRTHVHDPLWWPLLDVVFAAASALLAVVFGVAAGNIVRGVPLGADGYFFEPLWTDLKVGPSPGVFDWYTALVGALSLATLTMHGALYAALKVTGELRARAHRAAMRTWIAVVCATLLSIPATAYIRPTVLDNFRRFTSGWVIPVVAAAALACVWYYTRRARTGAAFAASAAYIATMLVGAAFALYPMLLPASTDPAYSLTVFNARTGDYSLRVGLVWWSIGTTLATVYFVVLYRSFRGTTSL